MENTSYTLVQLMKRAPQGVHWTHFYNLYGNAIVRYGCKLGLSLNHSYELLQETMVAMMTAIHKYDHERAKFRSFLFGIVHKQALVMFRKQGRLNEISVSLDDSSLAIVRNISDQSVDSNDQRNLWQLSLLEQCIENMRTSGRFSQQTVDIFDDYVLKEIPVADVAEMYQTDANNVYQIKARLVTYLREKMKILEDGVAEVDED